MVKHFRHFFLVPSLHEKEVLFLLLFAKTFSKTCFKWDWDAWLPMFPECWSFKLRKVSKQEVKRPKIWRLEKGAQQLHMFVLHSVGTQKNTFFYKAKKDRVFVFVAIASNGTRTKWKMALFFGTAWFSAKNFFTI